MDTGDRIRQLWDYGHFWNPHCPDCWNVTENDLPRLTEADQVVQQAVASFQEFMQPDMDDISAATHGRPSQADGVVGPVTDAVLSAERCGFADYPNPTAAVGSGSWPAGCHGTENVHEVWYHLDSSRMPDSLAQRMPEVFAEVEAAYAEVGCLLKRGPDDPERCDILVSWKPLRGSTIGLAEFNSQSCRDTVFHYLDPNYTGYMFELVCHEFGHNMNLQHTRAGGIMYPSVRDLSPHKWQRSDPSYRTLVRYFGGEPVSGQPQPPDEIPEPAPPEIEPGQVYGTMQLKHGVETLGEFVVIPRPKL